MPEMPVLLVRLKFPDPDEGVSGQEFGGVEEEGYLARGGFWSVGAVYRVSLDVYAQVFADGAGCGFGRVGGPHQCSPPGDSLLAGQHGYYDWARGHVFAQRLVERSLLVNLIEPFRLRPSQVKLLQRAYLKPLRFDAFENFAGVATLDGIGLYDR